MNKDNVEIERTILDGRAAERHTYFNGEDEKVTEIFAEEKRPLNLEKRVIQKYKKVVAEERTEMVKDGEIVEVEVKSIDPGVQMQIRERIGVADHAYTVDGQYATKQDVAEAVIEGVKVLVDSMENYEPVEAQHYHGPVMSAAEQIEQRVGSKEAKNANNDMAINVVMGVLILAQLAFGFYVFFM